MRDLDRTIDGWIRRLARETEAPATFIEQVRVLFTGKGISLDADATPYENALREAFRRELAIRRSTLRARRDSEDGIERRLRALRSGYRRQVERLQRTQRALDRRASSLREGSCAAIAGASGDGASLATSATTPVQRDLLPMVPGPEGTQ